MTQYDHFLADDPSEFEMALRPWDVLFDATHRANQKFELEYFSMPGLTVYRDHYPDGAQLVGMPPPAQLVLGVPVGGCGESAYYKTGTIDRQLYSLTGEALEACYGRGHSNLVVLLDLSRKFKPSLELSVEKLASQSRNLALAQSSQDVLRLCRTIHNLLEFGANDSGNGQLVRMQAFRSEIENALARVVLPEAKDTIVARRTAQIAAVSAMLEYLRTSGMECASVSELCTGAGVNERTLERGVRAQFDCTVVQLLRKWRLHAARQRLVATGRDESTVSDIAMSLGFFDLGRFASAYRHYFGEYPSETLAASSRSSAPLLFGM